MRVASGHFGLTLLETAISIVLIAILMAILLPALSSARMGAYREQCANNLRIINHGWEDFLQEHNDQYPFVPVQPGWYYGGVRFSGPERVPFPDIQRPLTPYLPIHGTDNNENLVCFCPADHGISVPDIGFVTHRHTAFHSFGTSYRANALLLDARLAGLVNEPRGLYRGEITTSPSRLVLIGDPVWYEVAESTGRVADWHGEAGSGEANILFLDGSVRYRAVKPRTIADAVLFDPMTRAKHTEP